MANILHVCNSFDPAADVVRAVAELQKYSEHHHEVLVKNRHPLQGVYRYPEVTNVAVDSRVAEHYFNWADAVLYHFVGHERGYGILKKPCAFRNINIYYDSRHDKFWSDPQYNADSRNLGDYKLLASSHIGAADFLPGCRWLPDLVPMFDPQYRPNFADRPPCVSYIKHHQSLDVLPFGAIQRQRLTDTAHPVILRARQNEATVVIDNICDGHFGMAGVESMSLGLPTICFNHPKTRGALEQMADVYPPFVEVGTDIREAYLQAMHIAARPELAQTLGKQSREWMEKYYNPQRIIEMYWTPFIKEMLS